MREILEVLSGLALNCTAGTRYCGSALPTVLTPGDFEGKKDMPSSVAAIRDDLPRSPEASEFPHALAAMARVEPSLHEAEARMWQSLWIVGDAVLKDIPIQLHGVNDGSYEKLDRLSTVAASLGYGAALHG